VNPSAVLLLCRREANDLLIFSGRVLVVRSEIGGELLQLRLVGLGQQVCLVDLEHHFVFAVHLGLLLGEFERRIHRDQSGLVLL